LKRETVNIAHPVYIVVSDFKLHERFKKNTHKAHKSILNVFNFFAAAVAKIELICNLKID
jgi:hypothetical protein